MKLAAAICSVAMAALAAPYTIPSKQTYTQGGTGSVARGLADKLGDIVSVKDFGAKGDGTTDDTTAIQVALNAVASGGTAIMPSGNYLANSLITIPKSAKLLYQGRGTFTSAGIRFSDSTTDTTGTGFLECPDHATIKLSNSANVDLISQTNFATLTTTANTFGVWRVSVKGCILDGNKANNASGWGVRLFGRAFHLDNVTIQNAKSGGLWTEGTQAAFSSETADLEASIRRVRILQSGANGWTHKGPNDSVASDVVIWGSSGWGWDVFSATHATKINTFLNTSGGIRVNANGSISGSDIVGTSAAGWGILIDTGAGASVMSGSTAACNGCVGIEFKAAQQAFHGVVANSTTGVKFNGGSAVLNLTMFSNTTWFDCTSEVGQVVIDLSSTDNTGTMKGAGCWAGAEHLRVPALGGNTTRFAIPSNTITYNGGFISTLPLATGTLVTNGAFSSINNNGTTATLSAGAASVALGYTPSRGCVCTDTTAANAVKCSTGGTSTLTIAGTGTDVILYFCF